MAVIEYANLPVVLGDKAKLTQLFQNLISNALKYAKTDEIPRITITTQECISPALVDVKICDNGIGMDDKYMDKIFEPFQRLHSRSKYEGSGLGLSLCRKIVASHGGSIWVESKEGVGSTFFISLPLAS